MHYFLRQAAIEDIALLDRIYTENMKSYVEKVYTWESTLFTDNFIASEYQVVESNHEIIGFIKIVTTDTDVYIAEIQISCDYQNRGIGSKIIKDLIEQASASDQRLWLKTLKGNPAISLYQELGFTIFETTTTHLKLELNP